jgi:phage/plasmid-like protein (TIGR03299 family)
MTTTTDTTLLGNSNSPHATHRYDGFVPLSDVANLFDFDARFTKVYVPSADGVTEVPGRSAIVHGDTGHVLNVVSTRYAIHQFRDVLLANVGDLLDTGSTDLGIVGAGLLDNGGVGWVQVAPADGIVVNGDTLTPTLTVVSSHNGKFATSYKTGLFRWRCSNQIGSIHTRQGTNVYKLKHTRNSIMHLGDARDALGIMFENTNTMVAEASKLMDTSVTDREFLAIVDRMNPKPDPKVTDGLVTNDGAITRWENRRDRLWEMWTSDERVGFRGTAWGAVQTFSTYNQHERSYRDMKSVSREGRVMSSFLSGTVDKTDRKVLAMVGAVKSA